MKGAACTIPPLASVLRRTRALVHVSPNRLEPAHDLVDVRFGQGRLCSSELYSRWCLRCIARLHVLWTEPAVHAAYNSEVEAVRLSAAFSSTMRLAMWRAS